MFQEYLTETAILDFNSEAIRTLIAERGWSKLEPYARIGAAYDFVRNEILFGYNSRDALPASRVLADGYGQCNTKATLLMALLRALGVPCRFHGFTIDKSLQRGVVPEFAYPLTPQNILHSWVEVHLDGEWLNLEGFILDAQVVASLQQAFPARNALCAYGAGTDSLQNPDVDWRGASTYIQKTGINQDFGFFDNPDDFYADHVQLTGLRGLYFRNVVRHVMNRRLAKMRKGYVPTIPGGDKNLAPADPFLNTLEVI